MTNSLLPVISVVLPVYNAEAYIEESIISILNQTFKDFELILINDGSTDNSFEIMKKLSVTDERIKLITRENKGLIATLNEGITIARGAWIARMDADDIAFPQRFEKQLYYLNKAGADICGTWIELFGASDKRTVKHCSSDLGIKIELLFGSPFCHPTVIMSAEKAKILLYISGWDNCEDYDLWERAARNDWVMTNVPEVLLKYRLHENQVSVVYQSKQQELTQTIRRRYWAHFLKFHNLKGSDYSEALTLREESPYNVDMNAVDSAFTALLELTDKESSPLIFEHMTKLYFRSAGVCSSVAFRWSKLAKKHNVNYLWSTFFALWLLSKFKLTPDSNFFNFLKKMHAWFSN